MSTRCKPSKVLLVGWQRQAVAALTRHGAAVTCVMEPADIPKSRESSLSTDVVVVDVASSEDVVAGLARNLLVAEDFDSICSAREKAVLTAALVAGAEGNTTPKPLVAVALRDKARQKKLIAEAGIPVTNNWVLDDIRCLHEFVDRLPLVLKPLNGVSTLDIFRVEDGTDINGLVRRTTKLGNIGPWLAESWVHGTELAVDGVIRGGELQFFAVSAYLANVFTVREHVPHGAVTLHPVSHPELYKRVGDFMGGALKALDHRDGVFHAELFETSEGLVFSECGGRPGGGYFPASLKEMFNVDLYDEWARSVLAMPSVATRNSVESTYTYGWANLTAQPGRLTQIPDTQEVLEQHGVVRAEVKLSAGDVMCDTTRASNLRAGLVLIRGADAANVSEQLYSLVDWYSAQTLVTPNRRGKV